jgi:excisionase family DNA binding protein
MPAIHESESDPVKISDNQPIRACSDEISVSQLGVPILPGVKVMVPTSPTAEPKAAADLPRLAYSISEAAVMLGVCDKTVRRLISRRLIRPSRALRHLLIPKKEIERFLNDTSA